MRARPSSFLALCALLLWPALPGLSVIEAPGPAPPPAGATLPGEAAQAGSRPAPAPVTLQPAQPPGPLALEWWYDFPDLAAHLVFGSSPAVADTGLDNVRSPGEVGADLEIMTGTDEAWRDTTCLGKWRMFDSRGALEWERCTFSDEPGSSPFLSDVDGDCEYEVGGGTTSGAIFQVMDREGRFEWYWPSTLRDAISWTEYWHPSPAVADLFPDEPGREIVTARYDGKVRVFRGTDGLILWESQITSGDASCFGTTCDLFINSSPAVGDVDGDGVLDVVIGTNNDTVVALNGDGTLQWQFSANTNVMASPALADFDGDGDLEVVVGEDGGYVHFLDGDENGNGTIDAAEFASYNTRAIMRSSAAIGNVDGTGALEVIVGGGNGVVYSLGYDVANDSVDFHWARSMSGPVVSSPALADRLDDGTLDIYVGDQAGTLYLMDGTTGSITDTIVLGKPLTTSPTVADIDGDNRLEILIGGLSIEDTLYVVEDGGSNVPARAIEWGKFRHDDRNTGRYGVPYPTPMDPCCTNGAPRPDPGGPYVEECAGEETLVTLDGSATSDPDGDALTYTWEGPFLESPIEGEVVTVTFTDLGVFDVTLTVQDDCNPAETSTTTVTIEDTTPPTIEPGGEILGCLWSPNHWYVCLTTDDLAPVIDDLCCDPPTWRFEGCRSNQPDEARDPDDPDWNGDGSFTEDCVVRRAGELLCVRAERAGSGTEAQGGRHYGLSIVAEDDCGNLSDPVGIGALYVPHDQDPREKECLKSTKLGLRPNQPLP